MKRKIYWFFLACVLFSSLAFSQEKPSQEIKLPPEIAGMTPREMIDKSDVLMRGDNSYSEMVMVVHNDKWKSPEMTMEMKAWEDRLKDTFFIRITGPTSRVRGMGFLKLEDNLWQYQPRSERVTKVHPSLMLQSWMGSDFSNDDLVNDSSIVDDYTHKVVGVGEEDGHTTVTIELIPKPDAPVVWGKILTTMRVDGFIPIRHEFYDEDGVKVRLMQMKEIKQMGDRTIPTVMYMENLEEQGHWTRLTYNKIEFNIDINPRIFTQANLKSKDY